MGKIENIEVFNDTERLCNENKRINDSLKKSIKNQVIVHECDSINKPELMVYEEAAKVVVSKKRSFEAASAYKDNIVCVHNFASASNPGGEVENGATAQEECLCRISDLFFCLKTDKMYNGFYKIHKMQHDPLHNDDLIYTPEIVVFKSDTSQPQLLPEEEWQNVNVITCAAPNLRAMPGNSYNSGDGKKAARISDKDLLALHEKRLRRILDVAVLNHNEVVILGAFGCGVFLNSPEVVAQAAKNVIMDYMHAFKTIEFAVFCGRDESNYEAFNRILIG